MGLIKAFGEPGGALLDKPAVAPGIRVSLQTRARSASEGSSSCIPRWRFALVCGQHACAAGFGRAIRPAVTAVVVVAILALLLNAWLIGGLLQPMVVTGESMLPALAPGERVLVDRSAFLWRAPRRWETVVLRSPDEPAMLCVKRIAGLPGETVKIERGALWIDGRQQPQPHGLEAYYTGGPGIASGVRLAGDEYFVLGDNSRYSVDSRDWLPEKPVTRGLLVGRALAGQRSN